MQIQLDSLGGTAGGGSDARRMALADGGEHDVIGDAVEQELAEVDGCRTRLGTVVEPGETSVDLGQLLLDCVADHVVLAERKDIDLGVHIETPAAPSSSRARRSS
jgi:two-component system OmpR family sensor kinase